MSMKSLFLSLFVLLALVLVGCGRSKPPSSKAATTEAAAETEATPPPPDALPPKPAATPAAAPATPPPGQPISFTSLAAGQDPPADVERQKLSEIRAKQAQALEREKVQRAAEKQNQPESERDQ